MYRHHIIESEKVKVAQSCPILCNPHGLYSPWNSPGQNTGVDSLSLLQGIFPTQGSNPDLPHCRQILYQLSHKGSPSHNRQSINGGFFPLFIICIYLVALSLSCSIQDLISIVATCELLVAACEISFPGQGSSPGPFTLGVWNHSH